jgi:hypothetical protein
MKHYLPLVLFAASFAGAQSLPVGSPTDLQVAHVQNQCPGMLQYIFGTTVCQQQVDVRAASSNPMTIGFFIVILYTDSAGTMQAKSQFTTTREFATSPYFTTVFLLDNITIKAVEAMPLLSDTSAIATVTNIP